jgi:hypothetical protein
MWKSATTHVRNGNYSKTMADKEAQQLLDTARVLRERQTKPELTSSTANSTSATASPTKHGHSARQDACQKQNSSPSRQQTAYQTAKKFLPNLGITAEQRAQVASKIGTLTPGIERLAMITLTKSLAGLVIGNALASPKDERCVWGLAHLMEIVPFGCCSRIQHSIPSERVRFRSIVRTRYSRTTEEHCQRKHRKTGVQPKKAGARG